MKPFAIVGSTDSGTDSVIEEIGDRLRDRGSVATVRRLDDEADLDSIGEDPIDSPGNSEGRTVGLTDSGSWIASGQNRDLEAVMEDLTPAYDYALVEGFGHSSLPKIVLGDHTPEEPILTRATDPARLDVDTVLDHIEQLDPRENLASLVARAKEATGTEFAGAIATFTGRVREQESPDDPPTKHLEFEKYDDVAEERTAAIRKELCQRDGVYEVLLHHRTGLVTAGEDIVFVVVLAGHREEAFETVSDGIDRLKDEVPLFKKEVTVEEEFWRHESVQ